MRPGREIDTQIAIEVFGHKVWARGKVLLENPKTGERPLRNYTRDIEWAWKVAEKMHISVLAIENGNWFAFAGPPDVEGWAAPEQMLKVLEEKNFEGCGASVGDNLPFAICEAALRAIAKRRPLTQATMVTAAGAQDAANGPKPVDNRH